MYNNFFETIDTEEKAYWLGFVAGDGRVTSNLQSCSIGLQLGDKEHLEKFAKCFNNYYKVKTIDYGAKEEHPQARISISSKKCCEDLIKYGVTPRKSFTLKANMEMIPQELQRHFFRGYFDANGSIYCSHPDRTNGYNYDEWGCNFVGSYEMMKSIKEFFKTESPIRPRKSVYGIEWNGTLPSYDILKILYEDCTIFLTRKKEKFLELQSSQRLNKLVSKREYFAEEKDTSILVGFVMGGASLRYLTATKTGRNKEKLEQVARIFEKYKYHYDLVDDPNVKNGYILRIRLAPEVMKHYKHQFYPNGNKTVTRHLLNELNDEGLFIWLLLKTKEKDQGFELNTSKLTDEEVEIIYNYFVNNHKIDVTLHSRKDKKIIYFPEKTKKYLFEKFMFQGTP